MNNITIPTGADFTVWQNEKYYIDKTPQIIKIKDSLKKETAIFFARPRRWGKSLFMSTIKHFFDERYFKEEYFTNKAIWQDKDLKPKAGKYWVINLDLKPVYDRNTNQLDLSKIINQVYEEFNAIINLKTETIVMEKTFMDLIKEENKIGYILMLLIKKVSKTKNLFLLIDEYDKPVNDCLKTKKNEHIAQTVLDKLKDQLYSHLKDLPCVTIITGVNKLSMASFFSDFNNLTDYSDRTCLGFSLTEVQDLFVRMGIKYIPEIKKWYNGYYYGGGDEFNPWAISRYLENLELDSYWSRTGTSPEYFRYLMSDILKVHNFTEYLDIIKNYTFAKKVINLDFIAEQNISVILHYFYYAGLLSVTPDKEFFVPNNDVIYSYEDLLFTGTEITNFQVALKTKLVDALEKIDTDLQYLSDFILFMLTKKYIDVDKVTLSENMIVSDVCLLFKTFSRLDLQRETHILTGRTDLEFIDYTNTKCLIEFKLARKSAEVENKKTEAKEQLQKYQAGGDYGRLIYCIVDLEAVKVESNYVFPNK